jgi:hypothetical protein
MPKPNQSAAVPARAPGRTAPEGVRTPKTIHHASGEGAQPPILSAPKGKIGALIDLLRQPTGATVEAMMAATGWQAHSVRGALSGAIKKKLGLVVSSEKTDGGRIYRIAAAVDAATGGTQ